MNKLIITLFTFDLLLMLSATIYFARTTEHLCHNEYEYTLENGNKGTSKACFEIDDGFSCRDTKEAVRVVKYEKMEVCE